MVEGDRRLDGQRKSSAGGGLDMKETAKQRVIVLGGGLGSLSAAFYLTEQPGWADRYDITVHQQGWRLGGKCASGHDMRPGYGHRIYEHGLHIFGGFYYQAFDLLTRAYEALHRPDGHPNQTVWDAFSGEDSVALQDRTDPDNPDLVWYLNFEPNDERPGPQDHTPTVAEFVQRMIAQLIRISPAPLAPTSGVELSGVLVKSGLRSSTAPPAAGSESIGSLLHDACQRVTSLVDQAIDEIEDEARMLAFEVAMHQLLHLLQVQAQAIAKAQPKGEGTLGIERFLMATLLVQTLIRGIFVDGVITKGFDVIDTFELSDWLKRHAIEVIKQYTEYGDPEKVAQELIDWPPIRSGYDYVFGYADGAAGDPPVRAVGAGTALRGFMLLSLGYKGHFFWKMRGAMGDVVIAPLYLALKARGVKFRFFNRVSAVVPHATDDVIDAVEIVEQAQMKDTAADYQPLVDIPLPGWPEDMPLEGWPAEPLWDQLENGDALRAAGRDFEADVNGMPDPGGTLRTLRRGVDFDTVVLGISVGGLKSVCAALPPRNPKWGEMFAALQLSRTVAMQLWFTRTIDDLGSEGANRTLAGSPQPYSCWSDMSHLLSRETWDGAKRPQSIIYFCGQLPGPENGLGADGKARADAMAWLTAGSPQYWRRAADPSSGFGLDPKQLFDQEPGAAGSVFDRQFIRANTNPSDLYVQSAPNSLYARLDADESGFSNLFLTGDWTRNGLNAGAAEAAAMSGARCAQAVAGTLRVPPSATA